MTTLRYVFALCFAIDSDTIRCGEERVHLARIDTPEKRQAGFHEAKDAMQLLIEGKVVRCVVRKRDKYGRLLGECSTTLSPSRNDEMPTRGLASPYRRNADPENDKSSRTPERTEADSAGGTTSSRA